MSASRCRNRNRQGLMPAPNAQRAPAAARPWGSRQQILHAPPPRITRAWRGPAGDAGGKVARWQKRHNRTTHPHLRGHRHLCKRSPPQARPLSQECSQCRRRKRSARAEQMGWSETTYPPTWVLLRFLREPWLPRTACRAPGLGTLLGRQCSHHRGGLYCLPAGREATRGGQPGANSP